MQEDINNFLKMGYYLSYKNSEPVMPQRYKLEGSRQDFLEQANHILESVFSNIFTENDLCEIVIPLSGGFDSRLILSYVLKYKRAKDIKTYTFGTPGTYDYEIGNMIASTVGTNHFNIDMESLSISLDDLIYNNQRLNNQCMLFYSTPFHRIDSYFSPEALYFSGFMGDPVAGSKIENINLLEEAKEKFLSDNSITSFNITSDDKFIDLTEAELTIYENIDFNNRQSKYIKPHVAPTDNYICPFTNKEFINFMFSMPIRYRINCSFYQDLCVYSNKSLFALPLKDYHGLSILDSKPRILGKKLFNHGLYVLNKMYNFNYIDKRTNYFNIRKKLYIDRSFAKDFNELYHIGSQKIASLGVFSYSDSMNVLKYSKNDNDLVIIASVGAQVISGKKWS